MEEEDEEIERPKVGDTHMIVPESTDWYNRSDYDYSLLHMDSSQDLDNDGSFTLIMAHKESYIKELVGSVCTVRCIDVWNAKRGGCLWEVVEDGT